MSGGSSDLRTVVRRYQEKATGVRDCWKDLKITIRDCPKWLISRTRAKLTDGSFNFEKLEEEVPTKELSRYSENQLRTRLNNVSSRLMNFAKEAMIEVLLTPRVKGQVGERMRSDFNAVLNSKLQKVSSDINSHLRTVKERVVRETGSEFGDVSVATSFSLNLFSFRVIRFQFSDGESVERCIERIKKFVAKEVSSELSAFLSKEVMENFCMKGENWTTLRNDFADKAHSKLSEVGFSTSVISDKMILQQIKAIERQVMDIYEEMIFNSSLYSCIIEDKETERIFRTILISIFGFEILSYEWVRRSISEEWIRKIADAYHQAMIAANIGRTICEILPDRINKKWAEMRRDFDETFDIEPAVNVMKDVLLKSFIIRRSSHVTEKAGSDITVCKFRRQFACNVALRVETLLSLEHKHLQPFIGVDMNLGDPCAMHVSSSCELLTCQQLLSSQEAIYLNLRQRIGLLRDVIEGLCHLHDHDITHGNIRLDSVLIKEGVDVHCSGRMAVIANAVVWATPKRRSELTLFEAPELSDAQQPGCYGDLSVDVFAFGVLLWYLVSCTCDSEVKVNDARKLSIPDSPEGAESLWQLFRSCRDLDPCERPTAESLRQILEKIAKKQT